MEIEIELGAKKWTVIAAIAVVMVLAFMAILGRVVTPFEGGKAQLLTPGRWEGYKLARQAAKEIEMLRKDADALAKIIEKYDTVSAMLLAEGIYARHRQGTGATAQARNALIKAAEVAVLYACGAEEKSAAVNAYEEAVRLINALAK